MEFEIERIVKREIISYLGKVWGQNKDMTEVRYFVKWKGCVKDENTWEPLKAAQNGQQEVERFRRESPEMLGT